MAKASDPDDLEKVLQRCFNICITRQELEAPTTAVVTRVLRGAFDTFGLNDAALEVPCSLLPSEAMHIEGSVTLSHYLKLMQTVFALLGINDVGLQDLTNPKPKRIRRLFKILINNLLYTTSVFTKYTDKLKDQLKVKAQGEHVLSMLNAVTAKANNLATQLHNGGEQQQAITEELAACEKTLAAYDVKKTAIMSDYKQLKTTLCASAEAVQKAELDIMNLKETLEEKRAAVCKDPAAWKEKTSADAETLAVLKSEIEKLRAVVSAVNEKIGLAPRISEEYRKTLESITEMESRSAEAEALQQRKAAQEKKRIELEQLHYALQKKVELATEELKRLMEKQPHDVGLQSREQRNHDARQQLQQLKATVKQARALAITKKQRLLLPNMTTQRLILQCRGFDYVGMNQSKVKIAAGCKKLKMFQLPRGNFVHTAGRCLSFYSLARSPKDGNVSSDVLESLLSVEEVLAEQESHSEDSVKAVSTEAVQVAVDHQSYVEHRSDARLIYYILSELDARISSTQEEISMRENATEQHVARNQRIIDRMLEYLDLLVERFETTYNDGLPQLCIEDESPQTTSEDEQPQLSPENGQPEL